MVQGVSFRRESVAELNRLIFASVINLIPLLICEHTQHRNR